jgi:membrane protease YdiL (CAAX protease family)
MYEEPIEPGLRVLQISRVNRPAKFSDAVVLIGIYIGAQLVLGLLLGFGLSFASIEVNNVIFVVLLVAAFAITMLVMHRRLRGQIGSYFPTPRARPLVFLAAMIGGIGLLSLLQPVEGFLLKLIPMPRFLKSTFDIIVNPNDLLGSLLLAAIVAPLIEEILFRGLILQGFVRNYGAFHGLMLSSLLFGIVHFNPYQFVAGFILGLFIGLLFVRTGSILPGLLVHVLYNGALIGASGALQETMNHIEDDCCRR